MRWIASGGGQSCAMDGNRRVAEAQGARLVRVGDGAEALPAPVLPNGGDALPALTQDHPPDMISGWIRLWIAGFLDTRAHWDGVICAVHDDLSQWLHVSAEEVVSSQSFLTPRLIAHLGGAAALCEAALSDSLSHPERLAAQLRMAEIRADPAALTGYLIGAELAAARPYWLGQRVGVIGDGALAHVYAQALTIQGCPVEQASVEDVLAPGLAALGQALNLAE